MGRTGRCSVALAGCLALAAPAHGLAQVLEIGNDGAVTTLSGPSVYTDAGSRPIRPAPAVHNAWRASRTLPGDLQQAIAAASARYGVSSSLLREVAWQESQYNQAAVSPKGARGVMQLMPSTAEGLGVDASDLVANVEGGAAYLSQLLRRFNGDLERSLAAYNAGPESVERYGGVPPFAETQAYVRSILRRLASERAVLPRVD